MDEREARTRVVRSLRSGQFTIPAEFRRQLGIEANELLQLTLVDGELHIKPLRLPESDAGSPWLKQAYDAFVAVRGQTEQHSDEEIERAINDAVQAVRRSHA